MEYLAASVPNIISNIVILLAGALAGVAGSVIAKGRAVAKEHTKLVCHLEEAEKLETKVDRLIKLQEKQNNVLRELNGRELDREHKRLVEQGFASTDEKRAFERLYKPYHGINGNGTRTSHYDDVMGMNVYPTKG